MTPVGIEPATFRFVAQHLNHCATAVPDDKYYKQEKVSRCSLCQVYEETDDYITYACPLLAKEQYIKRHDRLCAVLHFNICTETGVKSDSEQWYDRV